MDFSHRFTVPAEIDDAWKLFTDVARVATCFPGASVTEASDTEFSGSVKVRLGPIGLTYAGSGSFTTLDTDTHRAVAEVSGKDRRGNGTAAATITMQLSPDGSGTRVDVATDLAITGKPAQFGRGLIQDVSNKLLEQFSRGIEHELLSEGGGSGQVSEGLGSAQVRTNDDGTSSAHSNPTRTGTGGADGRAPELGMVVLKVAVRRFGPAVGGSVLGMFIGWWVGSRSAAHADDSRK